MDSDTKPMSDSVPNVIRVDTQKLIPICKAMGMEEQEIDELLDMLMSAECGEYKQTLIQVYNE